MNDLIRGVKLRKLGFDLSKRGDLYYFEGPFLSHFKDERGFDYLMNWVDLLSDLNRWMLFRVNREMLNQYFSNKVSLLDLVKSEESGAVYFVDIDKNGDYSNILISGVEDLSAEYLPKPDSFFDPNHAEKYALELAQENKETIEYAKTSFICNSIQVLFADRPEKFDIDLIAETINNPWSNEPDFINEFAVGQSLLFPLIIHYHRSKDRSIRDLIRTHSQAYVSQPAFMSYLAQVYDTLVGSNSVVAQRIIDNTGREVVEFYLDGVVKSTASIVRNEPQIYASHFNNWLDSIKSEYRYIDSLNKASRTWRKVGVVGPVKGRLSRKKK